ncbi:MAG: hypothetical protein FJZ58_04940, partial [Chlamydiae bacterium]|nr:hypothetical protein [Chlamydiota bacterium]
MQVAYMGNNKNDLLNAGFRLYCEENNTTSSCMMDAFSEKRPIPIGVDDFKEIITGGYVYVDKTLLIKEFWESGAKVTLVTRPRRFGKSIALSMIRYFFEQTKEPGAHLFTHTNIWKNEEMRAHQGAFPVIHISFKDIKASTWEEAYEQLKTFLADEIRRTLKPLENMIDEDHKENYMALLRGYATRIQWERSLFFITALHKEILAKNTLILIDEYDAPITHAYVHGYYDEMVAFMRQLLSQALKGNIHLQKGLMTGVVRTAKDGILSGLNNPDICTMLDKDFSDKFGFTREEVDGLLIHNHLQNKKEEITSWYNGYFIGIRHPSSHKIYNPWSVLKYLKSEGIPETYWANTGSTSLLERLIAEAGESTQKELETLLEKGSLENKQINQDVILLDLDNKEVEPWSFLFFAGYLTTSAHAFQENQHLYTLTLPNEEIRDLYKKLIIGAIGKSFSSQHLTVLLNALITGNVELFAEGLTRFIQKLCSSHDMPQADVERSLHLFVLGLLASLSERYTIKSNLESWGGRYDIAMHPKRAGDSAVVIECKKGKEEDLESLAKEALHQIEKKD